MTVLLAHALSEHSVGTKVVIKGGIFGEFSQRIAGIVGLGKDEGLENGGMSRKWCV